jgi:hypothetical protein
MQDEICFKNYPKEKKEKSFEIFTNNETITKSIVRSKPYQIKIAYKIINQQEIVKID